MSGPQQPDIVASPHLHHRVSLAVLAVLTLGPVVWLAAARPGDLAYYAIGARPGHSPSRESCFWRGCGSRGA